MKFTSFKRLFAEDYKDAPKEWFPKFLENLNQFMDPVVTGFRNGLTYEDNFKVTVKEITAISDQEIEVATNFNNSPSEVVVTYVDENVMLLGQAWRPLRSGVIGITVKLSNSSNSGVKIKIRIHQ